MPATQNSLMVGDVAPDFEVAAVAGNRVHLYEVLERSPVVLFFLVKAFTPVCTAEACEFRDHIDEFHQCRAAVFAVSEDAPQRAQQFARFFALPFALLPDPGGRIRDLYRVHKTLGVFPGRATFVIGQDRRIRQVIQAPFRARRHMRQSLEALRTEA